MFYQNIRLLIKYVTGGHEMTADNISIKTKVCSKCFIEKPTTEYYRIKDGLYGVRGDCKVCVSAKQKVYNKDNAKAIARHKKIIYDANTEKNRARNKLYYQKNSEVIKARSIKHHYDNHEEVLARKRAYHHKNKDLINKKKRNNRKNNPEHFAALDREWRKRNKEKVAEMKRRYKHKRRSSEGRLSKGIADKLYELQKGKCACCAGSIKDGYHIDHIMPLALGGKNTDDNIQLLRPKCNQVKSAKHPIDYMQSKGLLL